MSLTPADVHNIAFKKPPIGKRGYDEEEVDAFLDELEQELIRLIEANNDLRTLMTRDGAHAEADADQDLTTALHDVAARLDRARREAASAEQAVRATRAELERARGGGGSAASRDRDQASHVLTMAERTADTHLDEAHREAHAMLSDARSAARQITGDAVTEADALEREARQRHDEAMSGLEDERTAARHQIEELEAFGREYRTRLASHVESQLRDLDGSDEVTP